MSKILIIKISNTKIWFNKSDSILISQTNLPFNHFKIRESRAIYWQLVMQEYDKETNSLFVSVEDYDVKDFSDFFHQKQKALVSALIFRSERENGEIFDWNGLEPILTWHHKINFENELYNANSEVEKRLDVRFQKVRKDQKNFDNDVVYDSDKIVEEAFTIEIRKTTFVLGGVKFTKRIRKLGKDIDFEVLNDNILPEFDYVKFWFAKALNRKSFRVEARVVLNGEKLKSVSASSVDINKINEDLIDSVKTQRTLGFPGFRKEFDPDKSLFTADEFFAPENDELMEGNIFGQKEEDIINLFLENSNVRNKHELIYLSGKLHSAKVKIRFTNSPHFGFVFLAEGEEYNHFIWELLNSNATYIWSVEKCLLNLQQQYGKLEKIIGTVNTMGRDPYKREYRANPYSKDFIFNLVYHKDKGSDFKDGFPRWKHRINELLV